ncbi:hypothetical protein PTSG_02249 [Salpingoeca rosetta]|uniref:C2H2-type domain-containing protein n=1 Tax=Salpingoeca rosetta (strain ATCC 50818 / BSB-021) TaxID=946362 RepID=F2U1M8_SALR5|nr:uncharacterized protein PTSG_02249 [Salpingoeca rosetta]EGD81530.1 hypothetical protein PTSG_02249 [Salpingoeca rosetta]|eukprot:XP_004996734.1 hypothetical protein PTSG_02249 [Salpingoeca rosetta]
MTLLATLLFVALLCAPAASDAPAATLEEQAADFNCDRATSRRVRGVLTQSILPLLGARGLHLSSPAKHNNDSRAEPGSALTPSCPLDPTRDVYARQDEHRDMEGTTKLTCLYCGKSFRGEPFLDLHMHNRHAGELLVPDTGPLCLADYCDATMCETQLEYRQFARLFSPEHGGKCDPDAMSRRKESCERLLRGACLFDAHGDNGGASGGAQGQDGSTVGVGDGAVADVIARVCGRASCEYIDYLLERDAPLSAFRALYILSSLCLLVGVLLFYCQTCIADLDRDEDGFSTYPSSRESRRGQGASGTDINYTDRVAGWLRATSLVRVRRPTINTV